MCLILFSLKHHPGYPLIVAANRDERFERRSAELDFWPQAPQVAGGRDLEAGGTWLGITRAGRWAALTNYRQAGSYRAEAPSRGQLPADYLTGSVSPGQYVKEVEARAHEYNGFNLLVGDLEGVHYLSNREGAARPVASGVHGLSNHLLNTSWRKVALGRKYLQDVPLASPAAMIVSLLERLRDSTSATDADLPETGLGRDHERALSPPFVVSERYGTRASTVIVVDDHGQVTMVEQRFGPLAAPLGTTELSFVLEPQRTLARECTAAR